MRTTPTPNYITDAIRGGMLCITATLPSGGRIAALTDRQDFYEYLAEFRQQNRRGRQALAKDVSSRVRHAIRNPPPGGWNPDNDSDLMNDLIFLMGLKTLLGDAVTTAAGLRALHLEILTDETLPDECRGMLPEWLEDDLGLNSKAFDSRLGRYIEARYRGVLH
jgi:hypothetical protein